MIKAQGLSFRYTQYSGEERPLLFSNISIEVNKGEKVLVLGEGESGKTTLAHILSSLIPQYEDGELEGTVLPSGDMKDRMDKYSLVPQNSSAFFISGSVEDEIAFPLESLGIGREEMKSRVEEALKTWGLETLRDVSPDELSGGEKRRVMIASALVTAPEFVIYDEAFDDLDEGWRKKLLFHIKSSSEGSLVFSSRYLSLFSGVFTTIYNLKDGRLIPWDGKRSEIPSPSPYSVAKKVELKVEGLEFTQQRRSSSLPPFRLSVPSFTIKGGETVALMGHNGSGKSTFSRILCGLDKPEKGNITIDGEIRQGNMLSRNVGYMFQNPDYQIFLPTVRDELSYSLSFLPLEKKEKERRLEELSEIFSLKLDSVASLMGYGEKKRLQAAIYASLDRDFYILDELDSALSYRESVYILDKLRAKGAGILLITHDSVFASSLTDRLYRAEGGVISED